MKAVADFLKHSVLLLALGVLLSVQSYSEASGHEPGAQPEGDAVRSVSVLNDQKQRLSYALGMVLGSQFRTQSVDVDVDLHARGLQDAITGSKTLLSEAEARSAVDMLQRELKRKPAQQVTTPAPAGIDITFKLDPRLTRGMYMGDRWVSPPIYSTVQQGESAIIEARAHVVGARDPARKDVPEWLVDSPERVTVTPAKGDEVQIEVKRAGESWITVSTPEVSRKLQIRATYQGESLQVDILQ